MSAVTLDESALRERFVCAPGPGGQHVNRAATAVVLHYDVRAAAGLADPVRERLLLLAGSRATAAGEVVIHASRFRSLERNREDARARLCDLIERASHTPKARHRTRPSRAAKERRMGEKKRRAGVKRLRGRPDGE